jgi:hypothetical protein
MLPFSDVDTSHFMQRAHPVEVFAEEHNIRCPQIQEGLGGDRPPHRVGLLLGGQGVGCVQLGGAAAGAGLGTISLKHGQ